MTAEQITARRAFRRELRRKQRAIVRAPRGRKLRAWADLRAWAHELLRQATREAA